MSYYVDDIDEAKQFYEMLLMKNEASYNDWEDAVWDLVENLYQSENAIDHEVIDRAMAYLCNRAKIDLDNLEYGLQVEHISKTCNQ